MADPRVVRAIVRIGRRRRVPRRYIKAALETGIVESGLRNLPGGDADSQGWRQERRSIYPNPRNVRASVNRFYNEARQHDHGQPAGRLAADVQRPQAQYRGRYGQVAGEARRILNQTGGRRYTGGGKGSRGPGGVRVLSRARVSLGASRIPNPGGIGVAALLAQNLAKPAVPVSAPPEPSFSAHNRLALPQGYPGAVDTGGVAPVQQQSLAQQLRMIQGLTGPTIQHPEVSITGRNVVQGTGPRRVHGKTVYVGDSLGVGTAPYLKGIVGGKVRADVKVGRSSKQAVRAARRLGHARRIVFDAGTNDPGRKAFAHSLRRLDRISGRTPIYVPIVHGPGARRKNAALRRIARNRKDIRLVRWQAPLSDGIHPTGAGYQERARQIARAIRRDQPRRPPQGLGRIRGRPLDRAGAHTRPVVLRFVRRVAAVYGHPITLGTGTNHSRLTVDGNVSDHWSGHAIDLPATGRKLTRMGRAALIAAGMSPRRARRIHGGLFNINGHQVIFNTTQGGNHWNHLHVSAY